MRITQGMMSRGYIKRMNTNLAGLSKSNQRLSSGMKYSRASENTSETTRAFAVREQLTKNEQDASTVKNAESLLSSAEGNLQLVNTAMRNIEDRLIQANTGTMSDNERQLIANEIEGLQGQILQISNARFNDKALFSGSGNGEAPFKDDNGVLKYNGYPVDELVQNADGKIYYTDPKTGISEAIKYNKDVYLDIGLGLTIEGNGLSAKLDKKSAVKVSTSGLEAFGFGKGADGSPKNIYSLISKTIDDIKSGSGSGMDQDMKNIRESYDTMLMAITDIGTRTTFLEDTKNRMDADNINLKTTQQSLEAVPLDEEAIYNKSYEMSWMVTLQLGSKIIPPSIFDFIR